MTTIDVTATELIVHITGWDRLWTSRSEVRVPLEHVAGAGSGESEARTWFKGFRMGTNIPGLTAGAFYHDRGWVFWDVHDPALAVGIDLHDERYRRLVIQVEDPASTIAMIEKALQPISVANSIQ